MTVEQLCRDLLHQSVGDGLMSVSHRSRHSFTKDIPAGELRGMAQLVIDFMQQSGFEVESPAVSMVNDELPHSRTYYISPTSTVYV